MLPLLVDAARVRRALVDHYLGKVNTTVGTSVVTDTSTHKALADSGSNFHIGSANGTEPCKVSEPMELGEGATLQLFILGIDADCCREARTVDHQARLDETAEEPACVTQTSNAIKRGVLNGFDCDSEESVTCGNETHYVNAKADESCCPYLEALLLSGAENAGPKTCEALLLEHGFCANEAVKPSAFMAQAHASYMETDSSSLQASTEQTDASQEDQMEEDQLQEVMKKGTRRRKSSRRRSAAPTLRLCSCVVLLWYFLVSQSIQRGSTRC